MTNDNTPTDSEIEELRIDEQITTEEGEAIETRMRSLVYAFEIPAHAGEPAYQSQVVVATGSYVETRRVFDAHVRLLESQPVHPYLVIYIKDIHGEPDCTWTRDHGTVETRQTTNTQL